MRRLMPALGAALLLSSAGCGGASRTTTVVKTVATANTGSTPVGAKAPPEAASGEQNCVGNLHVALAVSNLVAFYVDCVTATDVAVKITERCGLGCSTSFPSAQVDGITWACSERPAGEYTKYGCSAPDNKTGLGWRVYAHTGR
jgi:hypothetical protein